MTTNLIEQLIFVAANAALKPIVETTRRGPTA